MITSSAPPPGSIAAVGAATVRVRLEQPLVFGDWRIEAREYCVVAVRARSGEVGHAFSLTREGPVAAIVDRVIRPQYRGGDPRRPEPLREIALASNRPTLSAGVGLRALSLVDLATWDLAARLEATAVSTRLGGGERRLPVVAIVGYPPTMDGDELEEQVRQLWADGWRRFKLPISGDDDLTIRRVRGAIRGAGDGAGLVSLDGAWRFSDAAGIVKLLDRLEAQLEWIEDVVPPGDTASLLALRRQRSTPIAMGDEQGGPHFPDALLEAGAVDVVRLDVTCVGGLSVFPRLARMITSRDVALSTHIFGRLHAPILSGLGLTDSAIEWPIPGSGVDPYSDALGPPTIVGGLMQPFGGVGFGALINRDWLRDQTVVDPDGVLAW